MRKRDDSVAFLKSDLWIQIISVRTLMTVVMGKFLNIS